MKNVYCKIIVNAAIICGVLLSILISYANAFGITPSKVELAVSPLELYKGEYEISNIGNRSAVRIRIEVKDWDMDDQGGVTMYNAPEKLSVLTRWLEFDSLEFVVPPNKAKKIKYTVSLPKDGAGEYKKYLIFKTLPLRKQEEGVSMATQISLPFYVVAAGTETYNFEVSELKIKALNPVQLEVVVHNMGNVHIRPTGELTITKQGEKTPVLSMPVNTPSPGWPVLPGLTFKFVLSNPKVLGPGDYVLNADFSDRGKTNSKKIAFTVNGKGELKLTQKQ